MQHPVGKKMAKYGEQQARRCEKEVLECLRMATVRVGGRFHCYALRVTCNKLRVTRYSLRIFEAPVASDPPQPHEKTLPF